MSKRNRQEYEVSIVGAFTEGVKQNVFVGFPDEIQEMLNCEDGFLSPITDALYPNKIFRVSIKIEEVEN